MGSSASASSSDFVVTLSCVDRPGIVRDMAGAIADLGANISRAEQSNLGGNTHFFQRIELELPDHHTIEQLRAALEPIGERLGGELVVRSRQARPRVALLVSRFDHCLRDLITRWEVGDLPIDLDCVISNHPDHRNLADRAGIPFHHLPVDNETRPRQEKEMNSLLQSRGVDLVVLARYMQILSDDFIASWPSRIINIHHSFLPAFPGAKPYHRALERGVKLIGATAHYATAELDEGPVIAQSVTDVCHRDSLDDLLRKGRQLETQVLASAVRAHAEYKILVAGNRTVVFT